MLIEKTMPVRRRKSGDINQLRRILWGVIIQIEAEVHLSESVDTKLRAANSLAQLAGSYLRALELTDVVQRLERLEASAGDANVTPIRRAS
jgi:hypothetical protein